MAAETLSPDENARVVPALHALFGALMIASDPPVDPIGVGEIAVLIGGGGLIVVGLLGTLRPSRWGHETDEHWIVGAYALVVLLLAVVVSIRLL